MKAAKSKSSLKIKAKTQSRFSPFVKNLFSIAAVLTLVVGIIAGIMIMSGNLSLQSFAKNDAARKDRILRKSINEAKDNKRYCNANEIAAGKHLPNKNGAVGCIIKGQKDATVNEIVPSIVGQVDGTTCDNQYVSPKCVGSQLVTCEKDRWGNFTLTYRTLSSYEDCLKSIK